MISNQLLFAELRLLAEEIQIYFHSILYNCSIFIRHSFTRGNSLSFVHITSEFETKIKLTYLFAWYNWFLKL